MWGHLFAMQTHKDGYLLLNGMDFEVKTDPKVQKFIGKHQFNYNYFILFIHNVLFIEYYMALFLLII